MRTRLLSGSSAVLVGYLGIVGYILLAEHSVDDVYLPLLLVGGCVLMHLFMHSGHGSHEVDQASQLDSESRAQPQDD